MIGRVVESTHIKITKKQRDFIRKAADRLGKPMGEFAYQCVYFIHRHRYDPYELEDIMLGEEFRKLKNQLISFIRTQEKEYIIPMTDQVKSMATAQMAFSRILEDHTATNATLEGNYLTEKENGSELLKMAEDKSKEKIARLESIISQKDKQLRQLNLALQEIKSNTVDKKDHLLVNISPTRFQKITSLS